MADIEIDSLHDYIKSVCDLNDEICEHRQVKKAFETIIDGIPKDDECVKQRYIITEENKQRIVRSLQICGYSKSTLFCDSLYVVCRGIVDKVRKML